MTCESCGKEVALDANGYRRDPDTGRMHLFTCDLVGDLVWEDPDPLLGDLSLFGRGTCAHGAPKDAYCLSCEDEEQAAEKAELDELVLDLVTDGMPQIEAYLGKWAAFSEWEQERRAA